MSKLTDKCVLPTSVASRPTEKLYQSVSDGIPRAPATENPARSELATLPNGVAVAGADVSGSNSLDSPRSGEWPGSPSASTPVVANRISA